MRHLRALLVVWLSACGSTVPTGPSLSRGDVGDEPSSPEEAPHGKLPEDVAPTHYTLDLTVVPDGDRFSGTADIRIALERPRSQIWLHGRDLVVSRATVAPAGGEPVDATWEQVDTEGVARLTLPTPIGPGDAVIHIEYEAPFNRQLDGLYRVDVGEDSYAFTQFEAIAARRAFPSFDEPRFKVPFDLALTVRDEHVAAANTLMVEETSAGAGRKRIRFATTEPIPTYLVAMAVGPLDVVEAPPIPANDVRTRTVPFRGIAVRGQGARLAYALRETPAILAALERYFGVEYPYDKLDIVAVPDFSAGAMENVGLVTFREWLLLVDEATAVEDQKHAFAGVMAHELAHMWFGNLVTMPWWDDIWLNEAFATWMASKVVREVYPDYHAELHQLQSSQGAMGTDSLTTARRIRQPIESNHDIRNAFDSITYSKGGGVLEMFERWLGTDVFRDGIRRYMADHRFGSATADDLLEALTSAAERDVGTPFRTFLTQPGVPTVDVSLACEGDRATLHARQARYLPVGSAGEREALWQIPMCVRFEVGSDVRSTCTLLTEREADVVLGTDGCPSWVMPNADGAGYFRFSLPADQVASLRAQGWSKLTGRERLAFADAIGAAFESASMSAEDVFTALAPLAADDIRDVATSPMHVIRFARERIADDALRGRIDAWAQRLYAPAYRRLGWQARRGASEDGETKLLREDVVDFLALTVEDPRVRAEAVRRGRAYVGFGRDGAIHREAVDPNLARVALAVAVQEGDAAFFDAVLEKLVASNDAELRNRLLAALSHVRDEALSTRVLALTFDERLRLNESNAPMMQQLGMRETRVAAWTWFESSFDRIVARFGESRAGYLPFSARSFCDEEHAADAEAFFGPRVDALPGAPRNLASALEGVRLCAARVEAHGESTRRFFSR